MTLLFYKIFHIVGIIMLFLAIGGAVIRATLASKSDVLEKFILINHGTAGLIILITGFGQLAKLGMEFHTWVIIKIVIWLILGGIIMPIKKAPEKKFLLWYLSLALGAFAGYLALYKPF